MTLKESIVADMKAAMRGKETVRLETIRLLRAAIQRKEVDDQTELDDQGVLQIVQKMVKQSTDAIEQFAKGGRQDLVDKENANISILRQYLPEPLSDEAVTKIISQALQQCQAMQPSGVFNSMKDMGKVMGLVKPKIQGRADMGAVSKKIKSLLS